MTYTEGSVELETYSRSNRPIQPCLQINNEVIQTLCAIHPAEQSFDLELLDGLTNTNNTNIMEYPAKPFRDNGLHSAILRVAK